MITITRDQGWFAGGGCFVEVTIDGKSYARIDTGETIDINVTSGRHILGISGDSKGKGLCGMQVGQPLKETATQINAREHQNSASPEILIPDLISEHQPYSSSHFINGHLRVAFYWRRVCSKKL